VGGLDSDSDSSSGGMEIWVVEEVTKNGPEPDGGEAETEREEHCAGCWRWMIGMAWMERQGQRSEAGSGGARGCEWLRGAAQTTSSPSRHPCAAD
jgi:hypothetical protein